ncbi:MAG: DUF3126 family protein [Rhizobiales bacterium]|nr:DUF3126 family protein [Hyphomicrobiales bacterium]MBO6697815.1 DUF3126 family protein [Hyphomicrobiales bacterium]MBO6735930.1 DUF3126 family protein [Hyphomicrobiales bacterium]MBO6912400.1 DUF3126 family protein [Hyphomicrobiales bacterium]MBO6955030.1 DUF3126 family protein [Hyphomicrobiales bacterium]
MQAEELSKLEAYLKRLFDSPSIAVKARPRKGDSAEVYVGDEFVGLIHKDDEDEDDLSYNFTMAILDYDLN